MSVAKLSEQLTAAGCDIEVFTTTANGGGELNVLPGQRVIVEGVPVTYFKRLTKDHSHFSPALLRMVWRRVRSFDVVHIHAWWNLVSVLSACIAWLRNVPVLISPRGTLSKYSFQNKNSLPKLILHTVLGRPILNASYLHTTSDAERRAMEHILKPTKIAAIPNFVQMPEAVTIKKNKPGAVFKLLFFSRIEEKKGLDILLKALPALTITYHLTIAGAGDQSYIDYLGRISTDNNSSQNISWIGFQGDGKFEVLSNHDLFILPSHDENFGNTVIEALSAGTAVLISAEVGLADYVIKNELGWICNTDPEAVSTAINNIAQNSLAELNRISNTAPEIIRCDFNGDKLVKEYLHLYQEIINQAQR